MALLSNGRAFAWLAAQEPHCVAVVCHDALHTQQQITRQQLDSQSNRCARWFAQHGVQANSLVTLALPNSIDSIIAVLACWKLGATPNPVSSQLPQAERNSLIALAQPALIVGVAPIQHPTFSCIASLAALPQELDDSELTDITAQHAKAMATGGSTGMPKLILDMNPAVTDPTLAPNRMLRNGVVMVAGPLYHTGPFVTALQGLLCGNTLVILPTFDAQQCVQQIARYRVDWVLLVPTMLHRIMRLPEALRRECDVSCLQTVMSTGAPVHEWLKRDWITWLGPEKIWEAYGGSERIGGTLIGGAEWLQHPGSVGKPAYGATAKILDEQGNELPHGEIGLIHLRPADGGGTSFRYIGAEMMLHDGYQTLGDLGWQDNEGYLYIADRRTDMIVSGGANVYPAEVEAAIEAHPAVRSCAVIGLPDDDLVQRVHAIVDVAFNDSSVPLDAAGLCEFLAPRLVRYKIPRSIEFVHVSLRDDAGKVRRSRLRQERL